MVRLSVAKKFEAGEKVYGYIRVSTSTQAEKGYGLDTQRKAIKDFCKAHSLELAHVFIDSGVSGTQIDRDGLTDLLAALNGIHKVVVLNTSRLWRDDIVRALIQRALKQANADIISIEQPTYAIYANDPNDFLINGMMELLDQYERLSINLKLAKGRKTKARSGSKACGIAPLGYRWTSGAEIEIDPDGAETVKTIYKMYLQLGSIGKLKKYLDENLFTTQRDNSFSKQALADILSNEFYKGIVTHGSVKSTGTHTALVSPVLFRRVQSQLIEGRRNTQY